MIQSIIAFAIVLAVVLLILKIIGKSLKFLIGVLINALVGFIILFALKAFGLAVAINLVSALIVGILGVPGLLIVLVLQLGFQMLL